MLHKLQDELKVRNAELHTAEETTKRLVNEKLSLEERILRLEKKKADEVINAIFFLLHPAPTFCVY